MAKDSLRVKLSERTMIGSWIKVTSVGESGIQVDNVNTMQARIIGS